MEFSMKSLTFGILIYFAFFAARPAIKAVSGDEIDYQNFADKAEWPSPDKFDDLTKCLNRELRNYEVQLICRAGLGSRVARIRVMDKDKEVYAWDSHLNAAFFERNGVLYYADYWPNSSGCAIVARDLKSGKQLWYARLEGIGPTFHSAYDNTVHLNPLDDVVSVYGDELNGRYVEVVDLKTGKTVGHKKFPKAK